MLNSPAPRGWFSRIDSGAGARRVSGRLPRVSILSAAASLGLASACAESRVSADDLAPGTFSFVDVAPQAGIDVLNVCGDPRRWYIPESNGTGAAWLDSDGDGDMDLFVANGARFEYIEDGARLRVIEPGGSRLYRNDGGMSFTDVSEASGLALDAWIHAVATADPDADGDTDLYLACLGEDLWMRNDGGRFVNATQESGLSNPDWGTGAAYADVDRDGDLDLYVSNYCEFDPEHPPAAGKRAVFEGVEVAFGPEGENGQGINPGAADRFFLNDGTGRFRETTLEQGLGLEDDLCSYACVFADVTGDGWPDLLVANDLQPSNLFVNDGTGRFRDEAMGRGFAFDGSGQPTSAMGLMVADVDGDGDFDVLRTNFDMEPNSLHINSRQGHFSEQASSYGLADASIDRLGWGGGFFDADLDGDLDLLVANGHVFPQAEEIGMHPWAQVSQLFEAIPDDEHGIRWRDAGARSGPGLAQRRSARGVAFADADDDGDLDVLIVDMDSAPRLLENRTERRGRWIGVSLRGAGKNRDAFGARVSVHVGTRTWTREARTADGLYSAHDPRLFFGLGEVSAVDRIEVRWPLGEVDVLAGPALDRLHFMEEGTQENR